MEGVSGSSLASPESSVDKSRVLDVKPLRTLVPMFPKSDQTPSFVPSSSFSPSQSGFSPFYPFSLHGATPFEDVSFGASAQPSQAEPGYGKKRVASNMRSSNVVQRRVRKSAAEDAIKFDLTSVVGLPQQQRLEGNRDLVIYVLMKFDGVRRRMSQHEDAKKSPPGRANLKTGNVLLTAGFRTNTKKRIGAVPGVEVGDIFFFRMELCVVGLHAPPMAGIDYMSPRSGYTGEPIAVSIVSSGGYDDDAGDKDVLIYTGQGGGGCSGKEEPASDQKLERGNLALNRSLRNGNEVRVIRGIRDTANSGLKTYVYDGLYTIKESWTERGKSGASTFKYKLVRSPGQPAAFAVWQSVQKWKQGISSREGLILPDLTSGAENVPVSLVNDVDNEKGPRYFTYIPTLRSSKSFKLTEPAAYGCKCSKGCAADDLNCSCIRNNGGDFPYSGNGILVSRKPLVYECGISCGCVPNCKNRGSQSGLKVRLEVFKTKDRGWGLRSWDAIRAGSFICEYAGEVIDKAEYTEKDDYLFDTSHTFDDFKWNYDPALVGEAKTEEDTREKYNIPSRLLISARDFGNVARFMNHSCSPNVFWQPVQYESKSEVSSMHIAFFAMRHIPPMTELTYDYGVSESQSRRKPCLCRSSKCKGYFG